MAKSRLKTTKAAKTAKTRVAQKRHPAKAKSARAKVSGKLSREIQKKAYELYLNRGAENGHDFEDWLEAERLVLAQN